MGVASNGAREAVASSLFWIDACVRSLTHSAYDVRSIDDRLG